MKTILIIMCCFQYMHSIEQTKSDSLKENGLYKTANDFTTKKLLLSFNNNEKRYIQFKEPLFHSHELWVKTKDSTYKFYKDDLWGYRHNNIDWRLYENEAYELIYKDKINIYRISILSDAGKEYSLCFSKDLIAPIKSLTRKNLLEVYHSNEGFTRKVQSLKWYQSVLKWNKEKKHYFFIDWL